MLISTALVVTGLGFTFPIPQHAQAFYTHTHTHTHSCHHHPFPVFPKQISPENLKLVAGFFFLAQHAQALALALP